MRIISYSIYFPKKINYILYFWRLPPQNYILTFHWLSLDRGVQWVWPTTVQPEAQEMTQPTTVTNWVRAWKQEVVNANIKSYAWIPSNIISSFGKLLQIWDNLLDSKHLKWYQGVRKEHHVVVSIHCWLLPKIGNFCFSGQRW